MSQILKNNAKVLIDGENFWIFNEHVFTVCLEKNTGVFDWLNKISNMSKKTKCSICLSFNHICWPSEANTISLSGVMEWSATMHGNGINVLYLYSCTQ